MPHETCQTEEPAAAPVKPRATTAARAGARSLEARAPVRWLRDAGRPWEPSRQSTTCSPLGRRPGGLGVRAALRSASWIPCHQGSQESKSPEDFTIYFPCGYMWIHFIARDRSFKLF